MPPGRDSTVNTLRYSLRGPDAEPGAVGMLGEDQPACEARSWKTRGTSEGFQPGKGRGLLSISGWPPGQDYSMTAWIPEDTRGQSFLSSASLNVTPTYATTPVHSQWTLGRVFPNGNIPTKT